MSVAPDAAALERLIARLEQLSAQLRADGLSPQAAAALVDECARTAAEASGELERLARDQPL